MSKNNFKKPPLSENDKNKKAEEFLNFSDDRQVIVTTSERQIAKKESTKPLLLRFPESLKKDLDEISNLTGISINAICLELLRPSIKRKLKELKED